MTTSEIQEATFVVERARVARTGGASCCRLQGPHPDQVVGRRGEEKLPVHAGPAAMAELAQPADGFHPAEHFFNARPGDLADRISGMTRRPAIERATLRVQGNV